MGLCGLLRTKKRGTNTPIFSLFIRIRKLRESDELLPNTAGHTCEV